MRIQGEIDTNIVIGIRNRLMLSQKDFAILLGVSVTTENRWENGHHHPSFKTLRKLRRILQQIENGDNIDNITWQIDNNPVSLHTKSKKY